MTDPTELELWRRLMSPVGADLRAAALAADPSQVGDLTALRKLADPAWVGVALQWATGVHKAAIKFPGESIVADGVGVEQATSRAVADYKAGRFARAGVRRVIDLCCGIGGDAGSLSKVAEVTAVDRSPLRAWMAEQNAGCRAVVGDVTETLPDGDGFHLDPDRRERHAGASRRLWFVEDYVPGLDLIQRLTGAGRPGAVKLGPGVDPDALPVGDGYELEWISERGRLVSSVLWCGGLAGPPRRATRVDDGATLAGDADPAPALDGEVRRFLFEPDPAVERAQLLGRLADEHELFEVTPGLGLLTGDESVESPWLRAFEVIEVLAWREADLRRRLTALDAGEVAVKTRGAAVDADRLQRALRGDGSRRLVVFGLRLGRRKVAVITAWFERGE